MGILLKFPSKETLEDLQEELVMCDEALLMIMEQMHPCFDAIEIENAKDLPADLIPFYDEEDLLG